MILSYFTPQVLQWLDDDEKAVRACAVTVLLLLRYRVAGQKFRRILEAQRFRLTVASSEHAPAASI